MNYPRIPDEFRTSPFVSYCTAVLTFINPHYLFASSLNFCGIPDLDIRHYMTQARGGRPIIIKREAIILRGD